ncbi:MAG: hypothetical protein M3336_06895 [Chloroflexota bacterium]|nr:hypothetical protein [Chloroflexota bacterium]
MIRIVAGLLLLWRSLAGAPSASAAALDYIGGYDPGSPGFNAMAAGLDGFAYLGSWGGAAACPSLGVRMIDVRDPSAPSPVGSAAAYPGTTAEHVAVVRIARSDFVGNVLLAGIQRCAPGGAAPSGLAIWDVSDPFNPYELAFVETGRGGRGVHEFAVRQQGERWLAFLAVPNAEVVTGRGDLRIVDITDPRQPLEVGDWGARRDAGLRIGSGSQCAPACRGAIPQAFLHSVAVSADGRLAYLSYWDQGVLVLDVSEPSSPVLLGQFLEPLAAEGNTHSISLAHEGRLALVADETVGPPWGRLRLVDVQDPGNPVQVGVFATEHARAGTPAGQYGYTIHNPLADDRDPNRAYLAWYADGVRLIDVSDASAPVELAAWVPPWGGEIWNVSLLGDLLLAGDITNGLHVLRRAP